MPRNHKGKGAQKGKGKGNNKGKGKGKGNNKGKGKGKNNIAVVKIDHKKTNTNITIKGCQNMDISFESTKNNMKLWLNKPSIIHHNNNNNHTTINFPPPQVGTVDEIFPHVEEDYDIDDIPEEAYIHGDIPPAVEVENDERAYPADLLPEEAL